MVNIFIVWFVNVVIYVNWEYVGVKFDIEVLVVEV